MTAFHCILYLMIYCFSLYIMKSAVASHHVEHVDGTDDGLDGVHVAGDVQLEHCGQQQTHTLLDNVMLMKLVQGKSTAPLT